MIIIIDIYHHHHFLWHFPEDFFNQIKIPIGRKRSVTDKYQFCFFGFQFKIQNENLWKKFQHADFVFVNKNLVQKRHAHNVHYLIDWLNGWIENLLIVFLFFFHFFEFSITCCSVNSCYHLSILLFLEIYSPFFISFFCKQTQIDKSFSFAYIALFIWISICDCCWNKKLNSLFIWFWTYLLIRKLLWDVFR